MKQPLKEHLHAGIDFEFDRFFFKSLVDTYYATQTKMIWFSFVTLEIIKEFICIVSSFQTKFNNGRVNTEFNNN